MLAVSTRAKTSHPHVTIHESPWVDEPTEIGSETHNRHFSDIMAGTEIGSNYVIEPNVMIGPNAVITNSCRIQTNIFLYKGTKLEDDVICGPSCVFINVNYPPKLSIRPKRSATNR